MDKDLGTIYNVKRVHLVNLISILTIAVTLGVLAITSLGWTKAMATIYQAVGTCLVLTILFFIPIKDGIKAIILSLVPTIVAVSSILTNGAFPLGNHYLFLISIVMISLYFDKKLILLYGIFVNIVIIALSFVAFQSLFIEQNLKLSVVIALLVYINVIICILYFLTKWGKSLVDNSIEKEKRTTELLEKLKQTMDEIDRDSDKLNEGVIVFKDNIQNTKEGMANINAAMHEMAKGVTDQAEGISSVNENMALISTDLNVNLRTSKEISKDAEEITDYVL